MNAHPSSQVRMGDRITLVRVKGYDIKTHRGTVVGLSKKRVTVATVNNKIKTRKLSKWGVMV